MFEGDIVLDSRQQADIDAIVNNKTSPETSDIFGKRNAIKDDTRRWPGGVVPYTFSTSVKDTKNILAAMEEYRQKTCIRWVPRTNEDAYVRIFNGGGCYSFVGRTGRVQDLSIGNGCNYIGTIIHEMMHAIGFFHEQSRADRDQYVRIDRENIRAGMENNFLSYDLNKITHLGADYDMCSVMHYGAKAFSKNGKPTIVQRVKGECTIGQRAAFSDTDIRKINTLYKCSGYAQVGGGGDTGVTKAPCVDKKESCGAYADGGYCSEKSQYAKYMERNCPETCNMCPTTP